MSLEVLKKLLESDNEGDELVQGVMKVQGSLADNSLETISDFVNTLAEWVAKHSASKKLELVLGLCVEIYVSQGFAEEFSYPLNEEVQSMPSSSLVSCILSLINSILKSNQAEKYIRLLSKLLSLSSFISCQKGVPDSFRRKGTLKLILALYKNLIKAGAKSDPSLRVLSLLSSTFCKMAFYSSKCREYMIRKGGAQACCSILNPAGVYQREERLKFITLYTLGSLAGNVDQQLLIWVSGGVSIALNYFDTAELQEAASFVIWRSCIEAVEVQELLYSNGFHEKALQILGNLPNPQVTTYLIGTLRRLSSNMNYKALLADITSRCFLIWLKELTKKTFMAPLKELAAGLGSLCTKVEVAHEVVKAAGIEIIIEVILRHLDQAKLVKTCVGALVNLSVQGNFYVEGIVDRITSNLKFYEVVNSLLETYYASNFMMEYVLKLILNGMQNNNCLYHLSEVAFLMKIKRVLEICQNEEDIFLLVICILRATVSHSKKYLEKGLDVFKETMPANVVDMLLNGYQKNLANIKILTEVILLLSAISQEEGPYLEYLKTCSALSESIKASLDFHAMNKTHTSVLTECMANLPVEEFNMIL